MLLHAENRSHGAALGTTLRVIYRTYAVRMRRRAGVPMSARRSLACSLEQFPRF